MSDEDVIRGRVEPADNITRSSIWSFTDEVASLHVKLKRVASSNDPTGRPVVHHGQVTFHYDLSRTG